MYHKEAKLKFEVTTWTSDQYSVKDGKLKKKQQITNTHSMHISQKVIKSNKNQLLKKSEKKYGI